MISDANWKVRLKTLTSLEISNLDSRENVILVAQKKGSVLRLCFRSSKKQNFLITQPIRVNNVTP